MVDPPEAAAVYSTTTYQVLVPDETVTYRYTYNGGSLTQMTAGNDTLYFSYANGTPMSVTYNGTTYYYVTNLQGDVIAILNTAGTAVVEYTYDAWGNILTVSGSMSETLGEVNPLTYRGYVYDHETGLYYLQSRYYDPEVGRFINADALVSTGQGLLGNNMFAYCLNNPVNRADAQGYVSYTEVEDQNNDNNPLNDVAKMGNGKPGSPVKVGKGVLRGINAHAFKNEFVKSNVAQWDIFKDTTNNSMLWLGNKAQTIWIETGYCLEELYEIFPK